MSQATTTSDRSDRMERPRGRLLRNAWVVVTIFVAVVGYTVGWQGGVRETTNQFKDENSKLQSDNQRFSKENSNQATQIANMQSQLKNTQSQLASVNGPVAVFDINPNESIVVSGSHLTIGLVGSPANDRVNINVNGKQQALAAGDVINTMVSANCRVELKSFEMFKAVVATTCADAKP
jgi:hypothetical protein